MRLENAFETILSLWGTVECFPNDHEQIIEFFVSTCTEGLLP